MKIDASIRAAILAVVDRRRPSGCLSVWITGSRAKGTARPDSDWDVVAIHPRAHPILPGHEGPAIVDKETIFNGDVVELVDGRSGGPTGDKAVASVPSAK